MAGPSRIWEVPVIVTPAIDEHTFICGATQMGATIWDRQQATIFLSDSHASNFIAQIVTVLADERLALTVTRPEAFVVGTWASS
jgi:HK97 family phage major capsid protein